MMYRAGIQPVRNSRSVLGPGRTSSHGGMSLNFDAPQLREDRATQSLGQEYSNLSLGGTVSGPSNSTRRSTTFRINSVVERTISRTPNHNQMRRGLQAAGVAADSVARLLSLLQTAGIPFTTGGTGSSRLSDQGSLFAASTLRLPRHLTGHAEHHLQRKLEQAESSDGISQRSLPSHSGDRTIIRGGIQARHNTVRAQRRPERDVSWLQRLACGATPFLSMPGGQVRVNSVFADGASSVQNLSFAESSLNSTQTSNTTDFLNQLS